jgi:putative hydrolase of the HAD superfamily
MTAPKAVLLDVGGVFFLPAHDRLVAAFARAECDVSSDVLDRAHYFGAAGLDRRGADEEWPTYWRHYLDAYITACEIPDDFRDTANEHIASEFAVGALWTRVIPGSVDGLRALEATGVRLGIISNADGTVEQQLRDEGILQVGPGAGVEVDIVIDSTAVDVAKPDPRIFHIALDAMRLAPEDAWYVGDTPSFDVVGARAAGLRPFLIDPYELHVDGDCERVSSLRELAQKVVDEIGAAQHR